MKNNHKFSLTIFIASLYIFSSMLVFASPVTVQLHLAITEAKKAEAPKVIDNHLVLSYKGEREYRFVGVAFKHENFKVHPFYKNANGVYVLTYPLNDNIETLDYRIVADGLWMTDPNNENIFKDANEITLSKFLVSKKNTPLEYPNKDGRVVTFQYFGIENQRVYLYGDFNNWDPFMYKMTEKRENNSYTCSIRLSPGKYHYKFIVDGTTMPDPLNDQKGIDLFGEIASILTLPY